MGLKEKLTELADAIRRISGKNEKLSLRDMAEELRSIPQSRRVFNEEELAMLTGTGNNLNIVDDTVTHIRDWAFYKVKGISSIELRKVESIGEYAFRECQDLQTLSFPNMQRATYKMLYVCETVKKVSMPNCEGVLGYAFCGAKSLVDIELPKCRFLSDTAMLKCESLEEINLPSCESFGRSAFEGCIKLRKVIAQNLIKIERDCFADAGAEYVDILGYKGYISDSAFVGSRLTALVIRSPNGVMWLSNTGVFKDSPVGMGTGLIYVPAVVLDEYKAAANWSDYADQIIPIEGSQYEVTEVSE